MRILVLALLMAATAVAKPTLWIIGDSTVRNHTGGQMGWGDPLVAEFDPAGIEVRNLAIGGRSSRTFFTEGRWQAVLSMIRPGDHVLIQFGHNDGGELFEGDRPRASLRGIGDETRKGIVESTGKEEEVHSFGWYLAHYCRSAREAGAHPVLVSLIPRNQRDGQGKIRRQDDSHALWTRQIAEREKVPLIDFNRLLAEEYDRLGKAATDALFAMPDHTHTSPAGANFNARILAREIRALKSSTLGKHLLDAACWLPRIFADHMVLQRDVPLPVWGRTRPGQEVTVTLAGKTASTTAGADGSWLVKLPALPAGGPHTMAVAAAESRSFSDVHIGEVWLCSGQSNMEFTLAPSERTYYGGSKNWEEELKSASFPGIRMFSATRATREFPQREIDGGWKTATPENAGDFSAVAWFFGRRIHEETGVPVGLIATSFGGSCAEAWIREEALAASPSLAPLLRDYHRKRIHFRDHPETLTRYAASLRKWESAGKKGRPPAHPDPVADQHQSTVLWNAMIAPLVPYSIRGAIWYQGESNVGTRHLYPDLQRTLIEDWRANWGLGDFPFYFVQLAAYQAPKDEPGDSALATTRAAQATSLTLPHTGMAVTIDIGETADIHPRNKQDVGDRLARLALARTYGRDVVDSGPVFKSATIEGNAIRVSFDSIAGGLVARGGPLRQFAIAGRDRKWRWAEARIDGDSVVVSHPDLTAPAWVRYAWADHPEGANLFNSEGLPAAPFRTDP